MVINQAIKGDTTAMPSIDAQNRLVMSARRYGMYVDQFDADPDMFVTSPLLATYCVRVTLEGLHDLVERHRNYIDRRTNEMRASVAARHARTVDLMFHDRDFLRQQSLIYYDPRKQMVIDRRNPVRYREAFARANNKLNAVERRA